MALPSHLIDKDLTLVGEGDQGKVFLIDYTRCIKVYKESKYFRRELTVLKLVQNEPLFPRLLAWGSNYVIREYIHGVQLHEYLRNNPLNDDLAGQLLEIYYTFKRLAFKRADTRLEHIILTPEGCLRLIDPTNAMTANKSYPKKMLSGLNSLKCKDAFLNFVRSSDPGLAKQWER